jgi:hypothetical protein
VASDRHRSVRLVEDRHLAAIAESDFLWLVAPDGYVGPSASFEMGCAVTRGIPIYTAAEIPDVSLNRYVTKVDRIDEALEFTFSSIIKTDDEASLLIAPKQAIESAHERLQTVEAHLSVPGAVNDANVLSVVHGQIRQLNRVVRLPAPIGNRT